MVDIDPSGGNYDGTVVRNNIIAGGFATDNDSANLTKGDNADSAIVKFVISHLLTIWWSKRVVV